MALAVARRGAEEVLADADVGSEGGLDDAFEAFPQGIGVEEVWVGQGDVAMLDLVAEDVEEEGDEVLFVVFGEFADLSRNLVPWVTGVSISCIWGPSTLNERDSSQGLSGRFVAGNKTSQISNHFSTRCTS